RAHPRRQRDRHVRRPLAQLRTRWAPLFAHPGSTHRRPCAEHARRGHGGRKTGDARRCLGDGTGRDGRRGGIGIRGSTWHRRALRRAHRRARRHPRHIGIPAAGRRMNRWILAALLALALAFLPLHDAPWWQAPPQPLRWLGAAIVMLAWSGFTAWTLWRTRGARESSPAVPAVAPDGAWLIAWASQTGFARQL